MASRWWEAGPAHSITSEIPGGEQRSGGWSVCDRTGHLPVGWISAMHHERSSQSGAVAVQGEARVECDSFLDAVRFHDRPACPVDDREVLIAQQLPDPQSMGMSSRVAVNTSERLRPGMVSSNASAAVRSRRLRLLRGADIIGV